MRQIALSTLKKTNLIDAKRISIKVKTNSNLEVQLIPIGSWVFDSDLPQMMKMWREASMQYFFTHFQHSQEKVLSYLSKIAIKSPTNILFAIEIDGDFHGHIGLSNVSENSAEVDNVLRDPECLHKNFMENSVNSVCLWAARELKVEKISLEVLSSNVRAINLYKRCGFHEIGKIDLIYSQEAEISKYTKCEPDESNTSVKCILMQKFPLALANV